MNTIDGILYINLEHRKDRLSNIEYQLKESPVAKQLPIPRQKIHRIDAIYNKACGAAGCAASHVKALDLAINSNWNRVLIFEDDFGWKDDTKYIVECLASIDTLSSTVKWDVLFLSTNVICMRKISSVGKLIRIKNAQAAHGYIITGIEYMKKLRDSFKESLKMLLLGKPIPIYAIDMLWKQYQVNDNWFCFTKQLGKQIVSMSDISHDIRKINPF